MRRAYLSAAITWVATCVLWFYYMDLEFTSAVEPTEVTRKRINGGRNHGNIGTGMVVRSIDAKTGWENSLAQQVQGYTAVTARTQASVPLAGQARPASDPRPAEQPPPVRPDRLPRLVQQAPPSGQIAPPIRPGRRVHHPPACARDDPNSSWWDSTFVVYQNHIDPVHGLLGQRLSYKQRFAWIRGVLNVTKQVLTGSGIDGWILNAGTALGAYRCEDTLPWDVDCDVLVPEEGIRRLFTKFFNGSTYKYGKSDEGYSRVRGAWIDDRFRIKKKEKCMPLAVVDTTNGYYCDMWVLRSVRNLSGAERLERPFWPVGGCTSGDLKGAHWAPEDIYPTRACKIGKEIFPCAHSLRHFLEVELGPGIDQPDVSIARPNRQLRSIENSGRLMGVKSRSCTGSHNNHSSSSCFGNNNGTDWDMDGESGINVDVADGTAITTAVTRLMTITITNANPCLRCWPRSRTHSRYQWLPKPLSESINHMERSDARGRVHGPSTYRVPFCKPSSSLSAPANDYEYNYKSTSTEH